VSRVSIPERPFSFDESATKTRAVASATRLGQGLRDQTNHLLGYRKRGLLHAAVREYVIIDTNEAGGFWTFKHPNSSELHVWLRLAPTTNSEAYVELRAGTGDPVRIGPRYGGLITGGDEYECLIGWGVLDSNWQEVTITSSSVTILSLVISDLYSPSLLVPPGFGLLTTDQDYPLIGFREGGIIGYSIFAGPFGVINKGRDAWRFTLRQALSWWRTAGHSVDTTAWTNPFPGGALFRHQSRRKKTELTRPYRVYAWTRQSSGSGGYQWRISSKNNTLTSPTLTNTTGAWSLLTGLLVNTSTEDEFTFELRRLGLNPNQPVYVNRLSVIEELDPL